MELRQIRYFLAVVETGSFSEAAKKLHISQPNISQQIQALEKELGYPLLERRIRGFDVTSAGQYFYEKGTVLMADLEQMCRQSSRIARQDEDKLTVACLNSFAGREFDRAVAKFGLEYPMVRLNVMTGTHEELHQLLLSETSDLIMNDQRRAFSGRYVNLILAKSYLMIDTSARNPISHLDHIEISDLKNTPCILVASREQENVERTFYQDIIGFRGRFHFAPTLQEARMLVVAGDGVLPHDGTFAGIETDELIRCIPVTRKGQQIERNYCAFWNPENVSKYTPVFAGILKEQFI